MTDLELACANLEGHSICLCRSGALITDDGRGISPMMRFIAEGRDLRGFSAADMIVGRAAAMLFVIAGISAVHGRVMSESAREYLQQHGIECSFDTLTDRIINRQGTGICPMEATVADISDPAEGYSALREKLAQLRPGTA